jgi:hypothetical protein
VESLLPLLHILLEERAGERRLLPRFEVHGKSPGARRKTKIMKGNQNAFGGG